MPEASVIDAPPTNDPADSGVVPASGKSEHFKNLAKHMTDTLGAPEVPQPVVQDTRPVKPTELEREPKRGEKPPPKPTAEVKTAEEPFTSPKAADWKKLKADRDEWQKKASEHETAVKTHTEKLAALEKEYNEFKTKASVNPEDIEALKKERDTFAEHLNRHALAETPEFRNHYNSRFEAAIERAVDAVGKEKADEIKVLMDAPKSAWRKGILNELIAGMESEVDKLNLISSINEYDRTRDERGKALDDHKAQLRAWKESEQKKKQESEERLASNRKAILAETLKAAEQFESFKVGDDAEHNLSVAKNKKLLEDFILMGNLPDSVVVMLPILAAEGERLQKVETAQKTKIAELEEALKKYEGAAPQLEGRGEPKPEASETEGYVKQVLKQWPGAAGPSR